MTNYLDHDVIAVHENGIARMVRILNRVKVARELATASEDVDMLWLLAEIAEIAAQDRAEKIAAMNRDKNGG